MSCSYSRYGRILALAEKRASIGDLAAATSLCQVAARYAFPANVGLFASPRLEKLLVEIGQKLPRRAAALRSRDRTGRRHVLHVLSYGRPVGGDTRAAWRWMQEDEQSRHSVVITSQADLRHVYHIPEVLKSSVAASGGGVHLLQQPTSKPLDQALELRSLCQQADIVVLHLFPHDVIPVLALAAGCDSVRTLFVHHADHTFWVGASVADHIVHLRGQSLNFLAERRRLHTERASTLPIPLAQVKASLNRDEAKASLGYSRQTVLILTIASPFKYDAPGQVSFLELVTPVLKQHPEAVLLAVGPEPRGAWQKVSLDTGGRVVAFGTRWDNEVLCAAADIYLDSVPFSSITSLLEAGMHAVPLLGYTSPEPELQLLGAGAPGLDRLMLRATDIDSYQRSLSRLITDEPYRVECGRQIKEEILSLHTGPGWLKQVQRVYAAAEDSSERGCLATDTDTFRAESLNLALDRLYDSIDIRKAIAHHFRGLPYASRLLLVWQMRRIGLSTSYKALLPARAAARLRHSILRLSQAFHHAKKRRAQRTSLNEPVRNVHHV